MPAASTWVPSSRQSLSRPRWVSATRRAGEWPGHWAAPSAPCRSTPSLRPAPKNGAPALLGALASHLGSHREACASPAHWSLLLFHLHKGAHYNKKETASPLPQTSWKLLKGKKKKKKRHASMLQWFAGSEQPWPAQGRGGESCFCPFYHQLKDQARWDFPFCPVTIALQPHLLLSPRAFPAKTQCKARY